MSDSPFASHIEKFIAHVLTGTDVDPVVVIGPVVQKPEGSRVSQDWFFVVATHSDGETHFNSLGGDDLELADELRVHFIGGLISRRPPLVIHDFDDDLNLVATAAALWPSDKTRRMHAAVMAELSGRP